MLIVVSATRLPAAEFAVCPLGQSLQRMSFDPELQLGLIERNSQGLPKGYNQFIVEGLRQHELAFVHDDVWIDDIYFPRRIREALQTFDVVGLAGNRRLVPGSPSWYVKNSMMEMDTEFLSGVVAHGEKPFGAPSVYGPTPAPVHLLDGVVLAARVSTLLDAGVRFDERFDFHFYDMDFSRQAVAAGLKVGTWPVAVTHASGGAFGTEAWREGMDLYLDKWGRI